jgi:hypothetical protein
MRRMECRLSATCRLPAQAKGRLEIARTGLTYRSRGQEKKPPSADGVLHARGTHRLIRVCPIALRPGSQGDLAGRDLTARAGWRKSRDQGATGWA